MSITLPPGGVLIGLRKPANRLGVSGGGLFQRLEVSAGPILLVDVLEERSGIGHSRRILDVVRDVGRHVENRHAIHVNADGSQIMGDQTGIEIGGFTPGFRIADINVTETGGRWACLPVRGLQTGHAPAFLIDRNQHLP